MVRTALQILDDASTSVDGVSCDCSTDCCRFGVTGREPYVTPAEWALLVAEVKRLGRRLPSPHDEDEDERCPFLDDGTDDNGRPGRFCVVYRARPLGCRTFFCERAVHPDGRSGRLPTATVRRLRPLAGELAALTPGAESRPLRAWLRSSARINRRSRSRDRN